MPQIIEFESWSQIASQYCTILAESGTTAIETGVLAVAVSGNSGLFRVTFSGAAGAVTGKHDLLVKDSDGNLLFRYQAELTGSGTVKAKDRGEIRLKEQIATIDINPSVTVSLSPYYLKGLNPPSNLNFKLLVGEVRDCSINMFRTNGEPIDETDVASYDTLTVEIRDQYNEVIEASLTAALSGNVLTFRSTAAMSAAPKVLKLILWGNGPSPVKTALATGTVTILA